MASPGSESSGPRRAVVTGGGSGIGRAICIELAASGWAVAIADRDRSAAEQTAALLPSPDSAPPVLAMDVADAGDWQTAIETLRGAWSRLDLLVNNAGTLHAGEVTDAAASDLKRVLDVNLSGMMLGCHAAGPWLIDSALRPAIGEGPRPGVINVASIFALLAPPAFATYSASKAGVVAFSEALRGEWQGRGLNVTVALPGVVRTGLFASGRYTSPATADAAQRYADAATLEPETAARAILAAAERGQASVVIGRRAKRFARLKRWLPSLARRVVAAQAARELNAGQTAPPDQ